MNARIPGPSIATWDTPSRALTFPRARTLVYWLVSAPILLETAVGAQWDFVRNAFVRDVFAHLGYPLYLLTILGIAKVLALVGLSLPRVHRIREWAYAGLFFVYAGAASSHFAIGDGADKVLMPAMFATLTLISAALRSHGAHERIAG